MPLSCVAERGDVGVSAVDRDPHGPPAPLPCGRSRGEPEIDDPALDSDPHVRCDPTPVAGNVETRPEGDEPRIHRDDALPHGYPERRLPWQGVRDGVHLQAVLGLRGRPTGGRPHCHEECPAKSGDERRSPPACSPAHDPVTLTDALVPWATNAHFARLFKPVPGCGHPWRLIRSCACDGPDRHRRVCPEPEGSRQRGLPGRVDADSRSRGGPCRWAAACRQPGVG